MMQLNIVVKVIEALEWLFIFLFNDYVRKTTSVGKEIVKPRQVLLILQQTLAQQNLFYAL